MDRRLAGLAGLAGTALVLWRLGRLLDAADTQAVPWQLVLIAAGILGAVISWVLIAYRVPAVWAAMVHVIGAGLVLARVVAADSLRVGVLPGAETLGAAGEQLGYAIELVRFGAAPVVPVAGLQGLLAVLFWALGAVAIWGATSGPVWVASIPSLVVYLELATLDRRTPGIRWPLAFAVVAALSLWSYVSYPQAGVGRARRTDGTLVPRRARNAPIAVGAAIVTLATVSTVALASTVPEAGVLSWRNRTGFGGSVYGGSSFNLFVGLQQSVVSLSDDPVFVARVSDSAPPNQDRYWKLITLDQFDGENWLPSSLPSHRPSSGGAWERQDWAFEGPTVTVSQRIRVSGLLGQLLPSLYSPRSVTTDVDLIDDSLRIRDDGSLRIDVTLRDGWEYEVVSEVPTPDYNRLASLGGELSPIFAEAAAGGAFDGRPEDPTFEPRPDSVDGFLELPDELAPEIQELATGVTADGLTRFEKMLLLESWFRSQFTYDAGVSTGHSSLDLAAWLTDDASVNYRTGYCEQFATSMAVMARSLGIPSRVVVGFTPGDIEQRNEPNGSPYELIVVRERNAHAWVELWMDGQGWVRFDPTPRSDRVNPATAADIIGFDPSQYIPAPEEDDLLNPNAPTGERPIRDLPNIDISAGDPTPDLRDGGLSLAIPGWLRVVLAAAVLVGVVPGIKWFRRRRRLRRLHTGDVTAAWEEIIDRLRDLGSEIDTSETPAEIAAHHGPGFEPLASVYSAAVYGPTRDLRVAAERAFQGAESRLRGRYQTVARVYAWLRPTSLRRSR